MDETRPHARSAPWLCARCSGRTKGIVRQHAAATCHCGSGARCGCRDGCADGKRPRRFRERSARSPARSRSWPQARPQVDTVVEPSLGGASRRRWRAFLRGRHHRSRRRWPHPSHRSRGQGAIRSERRPVQRKQNRVAHVVARHLDAHRRHAEPEAHARSSDLLTHGYRATWHAAISSHDLDLLRGCHGHGARVCCDADRSESVAGRPRGEIRARDGMELHRRWPGDDRHQASGNAPPLGTGKIRLRGDDRRRDAFRADSLCTLQGTVTIVRERGREIKRRSPAVGALPDRARIRLEGEVRATV